MRKKTYMRPETAAVAVEGTQILAGSDPRIGYRNDKDGLEKDADGYYVGE